MKTEMRDRIAHAEALFSAAGSSKEKTGAKWTECVVEATAALETIREAAMPDVPEICPQYVRLLHIRGASRAKKFEFDGDIEDLVSGLEDLRRAAEISGDFEIRIRYFEVRKDLAVALVRSGEQLSDVGLLREAITLIAELAADLEKRGASLRDDPVLVNARGVAELRIGSMSGDRGLVEKVCEDLEDYLAERDLEAQARSQTTKNLIAALTENARLSRDELVYNLLIHLLDDLIEEEPATDRSYFLHYRATARMELATLSGESSMIERAIGDIEQALELLVEKAGPRLTALHSLAQAHFRLGKDQNPAEHFPKAVERIGQALQLTKVEDKSSDGRVTHLLADRAAYLHALGVTSGDARYFAEAEKDFRAALDRLGTESAPFLYGQIAGGLFLLLYRQKKWWEALDAFVAVEEAWSIVVRDPSLSSEVLWQRATELFGSYARAALCHLQLGDKRTAAVVVNRSRAQQLTLALSLHDSELENVSPALREKIEEAASAWERVRRTGRDEDCRITWQRYLDLRRRAGLDSQMPVLGASDLVRASPPGGALVLLFGVDTWLAAIIVQDDSPRFSAFPLPDPVASEIDRLRNGNGDGWWDSYRRFSADSVEDGADSRSQLESWDATVRRSLQVLGDKIMQPIHEHLLSIGARPDGSIVLMPPGELAALPIASARLSDGSVFSDHWSVSLVPNAFFLGTDTLPAEFEGSHRLLTVAEPRSTFPSAVELPFAAKERDWISRFFTADRQIHLRDAQASVERFLDAVPSASIVHTACHGFYDWKRPGQSGLQLAEGHMLTVDRLRSSQESRMSIRLIFLSCCETGIAGKALPPDELVGLLPAFLQCGAKAAIGTLWPVYDDAAMLFCYGFFEIFLDSSGKQRCMPATALARTQAWLRQVTLGEIVDRGLLSPADALEVAEDRLRRVRLRHRRAFSQEQGAVNETPVSNTRQVTTEALTSELRRARPYSSPVDWSGYVMVGL